MSIVIENIILKKEKKKTVRPKPQRQHYSQKEIIMINNNHSIS